MPVIKKKILFVIPSLVPGGAERVMSFIAQEINKGLFIPELLVIGFEKDTTYDIEGIKLTYLNKTRVLSSIPALFFFLLKNKPDVVISSISHLNSITGLLAIFFRRIKFIGREANVRSVVKKYKGESSLIYKIISKIGYRHLDVIICQSKDMQHDMIHNLNISAKKLVLINNPVSDGFHLKNAHKTNIEKAKFITVASLKKQKGHERILRALHKLKIDFTYTIVGDGPEKENIFNLIEDLNLKNNIIHIPHTKNIQKELANNDLFLQGAYVEGFPNCLLESCSVGTPIIAIKAPGGLNEIIDEGINGFTANNETEFIALIMKSFNTVVWDPNKVRNVVMKKFNKEKILQEYENLFLAV